MNDGFKVIVHGSCNKIPKWRSFCELTPAIRTVWSSLPSRVYSLPSKGVRNYA